MSVSHVPKHIIVTQDHIKYIENISGEDDTSQRFDRYIPAISIGGNAEVGGNRTGCLHYYCRSLASARRERDIRWVHRRAKPSRGSADRNETIPATFSVQRTRDGGSFVTRTVQGTQDGKCIFTSTLSFMRAIPSDKQRVQHALTLPSSRGSPPDESLTSTATAVAPQLFPISIENSNGQAEDAKLQTWIRAPREIAQGGDVEIQQAILAYLSDWVSISITPYVLGLFDFPGGFSKGVETSSLEGSSVGMLSSLGHTIYFHAPARIRADEWILLVGNSPWSGDERCLATARIFAKDGTLLATYVQEVRARAEKTSGKQLMLVRESSD
ncbi:acylthioesterase ii [Colletotrichum camelliae]|nr:acylthioesterase ii [Colletotrichum camelliae]